MKPCEEKKLSISFQNKFKALGAQLHHMEVSLIWKIFTYFPKALTATVIK